MSELIEKLIAAAREYGADASLETANAEMDAQIALFAALGRKDEEYRQLCAELAASQAEVERLRGIIREAIGYCSGSRVAHIGEFKAYVPQIDVEAVKRWRETVEGGAQ